MIFLSRVTLLFVVITLFCNTHVRAEQASANQSTISMDHSHMPIQVPKDVPKPRLSIAVFKDVMSGYNLELLSENYSLMPPPRKGFNMRELMLPTINKDTGYIEGHAHLYVNGEKVQRIYSNNVHLPTALFRPGVNQVTVSINNHAHMYWTVEDRQVLATLFVNNNAEPSVVYQFESFGVE
jgi:hypothetical protein